MKRFKWQAEPLWTCHGAMGTIPMLPYGHFQWSRQVDAVFDLPGYPSRGGQVLHRMRRAGALSLHCVRVR